MKTVLISVIPVTISLFFLIFSVYHCIIKEQLARHRVQDLIDSEIIKGNDLAVLIKKECFLSSYDYPKEEKLIRAALSGNTNAMNALLPKYCKRFAKVEQLNEKTE